MQKSVLFGFMVLLFANFLLFINNRFSDVHAKAYKKRCLRDYPAFLEKKNRVMSRVYAGSMVARR